MPADYQSLFENIAASPLAPWLETLPQLIEQTLDPQAHGDLPGWYEVLDQLPQMEPSSIDLGCDAVRIGAAGQLDEVQRQQFCEQLMQLHPWRKGPFEVFGIEIDTEWRSDWKWRRVAPHIAPLAGRRVLDIGCGNGYHCWRMRGQGAELVIGVDPTLRFVMQFWVLQHFIGDHSVGLLPLGVDDLPPLAEFDTVFSMGVLYHRRSPIDFLQQLKGFLRPGGQLVLETLVIEGDEQQLLLPEDRYAQMRNVWFIPSVPLLERMLRRCGYKNVRTLDVADTTLDEQRATEWMNFHSLADFLDPNNSRRTIEGYPSPRRAVVVAER